MPQKQPPARIAVSSVASQPGLLAGARASVQAVGRRARAAGGLRPPSNSAAYAP